MPGPCIQGTFATGSVASAGNASDVCNIPTGVTSMKVTTLGLDANNTIKTQKRTTPGGAFADQSTYSSDQAATAVTVAAGEEWRVVQVTQEAVKDVRFKLSCES